METITSGLPNLDKRTKDAMTAFREQQAEYEACLLKTTSENPSEPPTIKAVADSYYLISTTL